jgi:PAS domain S-box-containing protein
LKALLEESTDCAVTMLDIEGVILEWNAGARQLFGRTRAQAEGQHWSILFSEVARASGVPQQRLRAALDGGYECTDLPLANATGATFVGQGMIVSVRTETGTAKGFAWVTRRRG